jgi:hypothetical protein
VTDQLGTGRDWKAVEIYESGKGRRYGLLFTVNGGAYALIGFLVTNGHALSQFSPIGIWAFVIIPIALGLFSWFMCDDIYAFGTNMRESDPKLFGAMGRRLLRSVRLLFCGGWGLAVIFAILQWSRPGG